MVAAGGKTRNVEAFVTLVTQHREAAGPAKNESRIYPRSLPERSWQAQLV